MAREATARLYDVQRSSVVLKKFTEKDKYDIGSITFRAKKGRLIDLDKLHESIWATRLSGGTRSGLVSLEVTAVGEAVVRDNETIFEVAGSNAHFVLEKNPEDKARNKNKDNDGLEELRAAVNAGEKVVSVSGRIADYAGRWPQVLARSPKKPRRILVTGFKTAERATEKTKRAEAEAEK